MRWSRLPLPILVQGVGAIGAIVALAMWPPASGRMLLVPLDGTDANGLARSAIAGGALLLGAGPFRGSVVVIGNRSRIAGAIASWTILVLAAPPAGCGTDDRPGDVA